MAEYGILRSLEIATVDVIMGSNVSFDYTEALVQTHSHAKKEFNKEISLELPRIAESYIQHTESTFSSDTRQSMKRRITAKHLTEPKRRIIAKHLTFRSASGYLGSVRCLAIIRRFIL